MLIPILVVRDMQEAIDFYTRVLDFELSFAWPDDAPCYTGLVRGADELHLSLAQQDKPRSHASLIVICDDVDGLFVSFLARGLNVPSRPESPAHEGPLDQTWGTREVYVDDPSGNTLVFQQRR